MFMHPDHGAAIELAHSLQPILRDRLLSLKEVKALVGIGKTLIYKLMAGGFFPVSVKVGGASRWRESDVQAWIANGAGAVAH